MNIIIIEDEKPAARLLQRKVEKLGLNVSTMLHSVEESIQWFQNNTHPDLIFLDIQLSDGLSFEIFEAIDIKSAVIFTTAYDEYALRAFKLNSIDYLLKPLNKEDIKEAIDRFERKNNKQNQESFSSLKSIIQDKKINKIAVPEGSQLHFIKPESIIYIKADNSYSEIYLEEGKKMTVSRSIKNFEDGLKQSNSFCRIHKSYLINTSYVEKFDKSNGGWITLTNQVELPISSERINEFLNLIDKISR